MMMLTVLRACPEIGILECVTRVWHVLGRRLSMCYITLKEKVVDTVHTAASLIRWYERVQ